MFGFKIFVFLFGWYVSFPDKSMTIICNNYCQEIITNFLYAQMHYIVHSTRMTMSCEEGFYSNTGCLNDKRGQMTYSTVK